MNQVTLFGRLGAEPELNTTKTGAAVLKMRLATNERQKRNEQWVDHTEWHSVVLWGKRAESLAKVLHKGSQVLVTGALRTSSWEKDGQKRYRTEVSASDLQLCGGRDDNARPQAQSKPIESGDVDWGSDNDLPF